MNSRIATSWLAATLSIVSLVGTLLARNACAQPAPASAGRVRPAIKFPRPPEFAVEPIENAQTLSGPISVTSGVYQLKGPVRFTGDGFFAAGHHVTIDLGGHTLYYGADGGDDHFAVRLYTPWLDTDSAKLAIGGATNLPRGVRIENGTIVHAGQGSRCHAISAKEANGVQIQGLDITVNGADTSCIFIEYGSAAVIGNVLRSTQDKTADRHQMPVNVHVGDGCNVSGNIIIGGNSGVTIGSHSTVDRNLIANESYATNGYGVATSGKQVLIRGNVIIPPRSGRGLISGYGDHVLFEDNLVLAWNYPNDEFGWSLNACGVRTRNVTTNYTVQYNTILAVGGEEHASCSGLYLSNFLDDPQNANRFEFNDVTTILCGLPVVMKDGQELRRYAKAITLEKQGGEEQNVAVSDIIRGNLFRSNHLLISTSGYDGGSNQGEPLRGNQLGWTDGPHAKNRFLATLGRRLKTLGYDDHPAAREVADQVATALGKLDHAPLQSEHKTLFSGHWLYKEFVTLLDTQTAPDSLEPVGLELADLSASINLATPRSYRIGDAPQIVLQMPDGTPLKVATFEVTNPQGDTYVVTCDERGQVRLPIVRYSLERPAVENAEFQKIPRDLPTIQIDGFAPTAVTEAALATKVLRLTKQ